MAAIPPESAEYFVVTLAGLLSRHTLQQGGAVPLQVEIVDDGPGIAPDLSANLFEPFVSGRENGTGLGLALVAKILHDHGGWISVDSVPGRTAFRISLPMAPRDGDMKTDTQIIEDE